jgi:hypothetical protein
VRAIPSHSVGRNPSGAVVVPVSVYPLDERLSGQKNAEDER